MELFREQTNRFSCSTTDGQFYRKVPCRAGNNKDLNIIGFPVITMTIITADTFFFFATPGDMVDRLCSLPLDNFSLPYLMLTTVAGTLFHLDVGHFLMNMFFLGVFGALIEPRLTPGQYLAAVLLGSVLSRLISLNLLVVQGGLFDASFTLFRYPPAGASGAISGLMGLFALRYGTPWRSTSRPKRCPLSFLFALPLSVTVLIGLFFIRDFADSALPAAGLTGMAAYMGHVGGFLGGLVLALVFTLQDDDTVVTGGMSPNARATNGRRGWVMGINGRAWCQHREMRRNSALFFKTNPGRGKRSEGLV